MVSTKKVYRGKILNLVARIVGIVVVIMQLSRNHVVFGKKCLYCGKPNHFEKVCCSKRDGARVSTRDRQRRPRRSVQTVDPQHPIRQDKDLFVIDCDYIQARKVKFTAQWKSTANQLKLKLTLALNVM